jgi:hypothetical protein
MQSAVLEENRLARDVTWAIVGVHFLLLLISLPDYRVSIDSGYHISLARWYAAHGYAWWDHINFGPGGRPNLQGPALHLAIAIMGRLLGGSADSFILANAILGVAQWAAAILTALYFARRLGGDLAAMFAVVLLAGSAFAAGSFYVGIPSGWLFIAIPWAIHFFLEDRLLLATLLASTSCYVHLGGFVTVPVGIAIVGAMERRWRALAVVAAGTAVLSSPYWIHFLANLSWYRGRHGHEALRLDPLIDILAVAGLLWLLSRPREHKFLLAWATAPVVWLIQDPNRFVLQSTLAGSVIAGVFLTHVTCRLTAKPARIAFASALVLLATVFPLGIPSLVAESAWDAGLHFPLLEDWDQARSLAQVVSENHLNGRLLSVYETSFGPAIAVFTPVVLYRGHWVEVQPRHDPADDLSAANPVYVVPLAPDDPLLFVMRGSQLIRIYGGTSNSAVIDLAKPADLRTIGPLVVAVMADNAQWLDENAINNKMLSASAMVKLFSADAVKARPRTMDQQRFHAGRMEVACLIYSYAIEARDPEGAHRLRNEARGFGSIASFISDGDPVGYVGDGQFEQWRAEMSAFATAIRSAGDSPFASPEVQSVTEKLFAEFFGSAA